MSVKFVDIQQAESTAWNYITEESTKSKTFENHWLKMNIQKTIDIMAAHMI